MDRPRGARTRGRVRRGISSPRSPASLSPRLDSSFSESTDGRLASPAPAGIKTPQTAPPARRGGKALTPSYSFSTPSTTMTLRPPSLRKRSRTTDTYDGAADDDESNQKGGHSLRKRARVDYSFEAHDEAVANASKSITATRTRKRKADTDDGFEDGPANLAKRRLADHAATPASRQPMRKSGTDHDSYTDDIDNSDVKDTIEVVGTYDDLDDSESNGEFDTTDTSDASSHLQAAQTAGNAVSFGNNVIPQVAHVITQEPEDISEAHEESPAEATDEESPKKVERSSPAPPKPRRIILHRPQPPESPKYFKASPAEDTVESTRARDAVDETRILKEESVAPELVSKTLDAKAASLEKQTTEEPQVHAEDDAQIHKADAESKVTTEPNIAAEPQVVGEREDTAESKAAEEPRALTAEQLRRRLAEIMSWLQLSAKAQQTVKTTAQSAKQAEDKEKLLENTMYPPSNDDAATKCDAILAKIKELMTMSGQVSNEQVEEILRNINELRYEKRWLELVSLYFDPETGEFVDEPLSTLSVEEPPETAVDTGPQDGPRDNSGPQHVEETPEEPTEELAEKATEKKSTEERVEEPTEQFPEEFVEAVEKGAEQPVEELAQGQAHAAAVGAAPQRITEEPLIEEGGTPASTTLSQRDVKSTIENAAADGIASAELQTLPVPATPKRAVSVQPDEPSGPLWERLTPYIPGRYTWHPERVHLQLQAVEEADEDEAEADAEEDAAKDDADEDNDSPEKANAEMEDIDKPEIEIEDVDKVTVKEEENGGEDVRDQVVNSGVVTPLALPSLRGSPVPESAEPTAANSPMPTEDADGDDDSDVDNTHTPVSRAYRHKFPLLRDPDDFAEALKDHENMSRDELYEALLKVNECLVAWSTEYEECGRIVDDHENAQRRRAQDAEYERRLQNLDQYTRLEPYIEKDFEVRGYKAKEKPETIGDAYLRNEDRIQAAAYGFEYDAHPTKIGNQNPDMQREGIVTRRMLRNQPRQTARAAEADEASSNIVMGKRTRKPRDLFDGMQDISRSATPVPSGRGRGRGGRGSRGGRVAEYDRENGDQQQNGELGTRGGASTRGRGRGGRRGRGGLMSSRATPVPYQEADMIAAREATEDGHIPRQNGRRRGPRAARVGHLVQEDFGYTSSGADEAPADNYSRRGRGKRRHMLTLQVPQNSSFNSNGPSSAATDASDESAIMSATSSATDDTAESTYSFRPKRQRVFRDEPKEEVKPLRKRTRRVTKKDFDSPMAEQQTPIRPPAVPVMQHSQLPDGVPLSRPTKIVKLKTPHAKAIANFSTIQPQPFQSGAPPVQAPQRDMELSEKNYAQMTKSEKMSHSMKTRWANGSMQAAVDKRKATLAAKKAAAKAAAQPVAIAEAPAQPSAQPAPPQ